MIPLLSSPDPHSHQNPGVREVFAPPKLISSEMDLTLIVYKGFLVSTATIHGIPSHFRVPTSDDKGRSKKNTGLVGSFSHIADPTPFWEASVQKIFCW